MTNQELVNKAKQTEIVTVQGFMEKQRDLIARVLPKTITPERMLGIFTMILKSSPALVKCSQQSLIGAVIQTAQLGLHPGNIGQVYLVPFNNRGVMEVQLIVGYKGLCELVNRSGKATILTAEVVYENDEFHYENGLNPILRHKPKEGSRGSFRGVYCIAKNLIANEKVFVYLDKDEVEKVRSASKAKSSDYSPWNTWFDEMAKKTAAKRITKLLPLSAESQAAISADETIKTKIDDKMVEMPNEAVWEGETIDAVSSTEKPENVQNNPISATNNPIPEADVNGNSAEPAKTEMPQQPTDPSASDNIISEQQRKRLYAISMNAGMSKEVFKDWLSSKFGYNSSKDIDRGEYEKICNAAKEYKK